MHAWCKMRDTQAIIDLEILKDNYQVLQKRSGAHVFPVVKANAYGHGMIEIAHFFAAMKVPFVCVSSLDEALILDDAGCHHDILIFSHVGIDDIRQYHRASFVYTVPSYAWFQQVQKIDTKLRLHLEINTGMNRYGIKGSVDAYDFNTHHTIEGVYTHFSSLQMNDLSFLQLDRFKMFVDGLKDKPKWIHVGNCSVELIAQNQWINAARFGLGLYGYRDDVQGLNPVLNLVSSVNHVDELYQGEYLGYNQSYQASVDMRFATVPIGYGDGFDMRNYLLPLIINGNQVPIIGNICMDQVMVAVEPTVQLYDPVEIIGPDRTLSDISKATGISMYVILTSLNQRIKRVYIKNKDA